MNITHTVRPRTRRRQARIEQILDAAQAILEAEGPEGLTIARLAEALDYTVGAVYRYFPSKGAILAEVQIRLTQVVTAALTEALDEVGARLEGARLDPARRSLVPLLHLAATYGALPRTHGRAFAALAMGLAREGNLVSEVDDVRVMAVLEPLLLRVEALFEGAEASGAIEAGDGARRALRLWAAIHGATGLRKVRGPSRRFTPDPDLATEIAVDLLRGLGAEPAALRAAHRFLRRQGDSR